MRIGSFVMKSVIRLILLKEKQAFDDVNWVSLKKVKIDIFDDL